MARIDSDPLTAVPEAAASTGADTEAMVDLTASAEAELPPEIMAQSMGEYLRGWWQKVKGGDSGVLPVVLGIVIVFVAFQIANSKFLSS